MSRTDDAPERFEDLKELGRLFVVLAVFAFAFALAFGLISFIDHRFGPRSEIDAAVITLTAYADEHENTWPASKSDLVGWARQAATRPGWNQDGALADELESIEYRLTDDGAQLTARRESFWGTSQIVWLPAGQTYTDLGEGSWLNPARIFGTSDE